ncbi:hypothetical protein [Owenweeksia hongkongensis]|uniref:Uncharacterized protein n=1 Tax=Owenweeksia hongkongensis (strain DSM 17368 / CIP 108786 / JCM 12287 / NRRL B-23963 / UST20020801) TaxID=926562 RepID=G8R6B9_OWEHD|nr:hypothetical protein [Owenweeksia hongkongensis]AEV33339.1 hypothetical protein Oweho_2368 [Owenweeksia hongkongensis DSM 17368]
MTVLKAFLQFLLKLLVFSLVVAALHYLVATNISMTFPIKEVYKMHVFVVALTMLAYAMLLVVARLDDTKVGFTFAGLVIIKMIVSFAYLYPLLEPPVYDVKEVVFNFFAIYLAFLFFEVREAYILIQKSPFAAE